MLIRSRNDGLKNSKTFLSFGKSRAMMTTKISGQRLNSKTITFLCLFFLSCAATKMGYADTLSALQNSDLERLKETAAARQAEARAMGMKKPSPSVPDSKTTPSSNTPSPSVSPENKEGKNR
jgi:hypothetical protein